MFVFDINNLDESVQGMVGWYTDDYNTGSIVNNEGDYQELPHYFIHLIRAPKIGRWSLNQTVSYYIFQKK